MGDDVGQGSLQGRRVVVVGASAGIGRAMAAAAVQRGADVVFSARRADALAEAVAAAGGGHAVAADVRVEGDCDRLVAEAVAALGGPIDLLSYATGMAPLRMLVDTTLDDWKAVFETNVVGASLVVRAALPHLTPDAIVSFLSSESVGRPRHGLGAYGASKIALEELLRAWRNEHPERRFGCVTVGATLGTDFGNAFDPEMLGQMLNEWMRHGEMRAGHMDVNELGAVIVDAQAAALAHPAIDVQHLVLRPPGELLSDLGSLLATAAENTGRA
jgi:NAD(P)-dependent dehydrogenase (short-subunit alcohol dehydrogenase family)